VAAEADINYRIRVEVKPGDERNNRFRCPVTNSTKRAYPELSWISTDRQYFSFSVVESDGQRYRHHYRLTDRTQQFIDQWDRGEVPTPFTLLLLKSQFVYKELRPPSSNTKRPKKKEVKHPGINSRRHFPWMDDLAA
jgi:hypothetical protein